VFRETLGGWLQRHGPRPCGTGPGRSRVRRAAGREDGHDGPTHRTLGRSPTLRSVPPRAAPSASGS